MKENIKYASYKPVLRKSIVADIPWEEIQRRIFKPKTNCNVIFRDSLEESDSKENEILY
jgi:hypothetical protein